MISNLSFETGHVVIVAIAVICGLFMLKVTKKVIGAAIVIGIIAVITKHIGLW